MKKVGLWIGNEEIFTDHQIEVNDPGKLDEIVGVVSQATVVDVDNAVQNAYQAFTIWRHTNVQKRMALLLSAADQIEEEIDSLAEIVSKENGMLYETTKSEMMLAVSGIRNICAFAKDFFVKEEIEDESSYVCIQKKPIGVIAGIVPWNAPITLAIQKVVPAVVSGNTIVIKPSPFATIGVTVILKLIAKRLPAGVINIVHGEGQAGAALTSHPLIGKISFTGGIETARFVMKDAADTMKGVHFELGGNDPAIILDDVDLNEIMPKIVAGVFRRSGQFCFAIKRIYVPRSMYEDFFRKMCEVTDKFTIGHQLDKKATFGPLNNEKHYNAVNGLLKRVKESQAEVIALGNKLDPDQWNNGYYVRPVIVKNAQQDDEIVQCEQFGPIIPLIPYESTEEAITYANDTQFGLGSSVWSNNIRRAINIADQIEAGLTFVNGNGQTTLGHKEIPFGGVKQSGIGRENSKMVFNEYVEYHGINVHRM